MSKANKPNKAVKLTVTWETVPNPDPYDLLKAVALVFRRQVPLSPGVDLTVPHKTLKSEQQP